MEHFPILAYLVTVCIYVSASASLSDIPSSAIGIKSCKILQLKSIGQQSRKEE